MDLSEQGIAETSFGENVGQINEDSSVIDLDLVIGKLSVSPTHCESSCFRADGTSVSMAKSDVSGADLLSAVDSTTFTEPLDPGEDAATDSIKADAFDSIGQADPSGQRPDEGECSRRFDSSDLASIAEPSTQRDSEAEVLVGIGETCKSNHRLIVYSSSRRRSACNTKLSQSHVSTKPSRRGSIANKNSVLDLSSLQKLRRSRSSFSKRARSSVWGHLGNILPDSKVKNVPDLELGNENKLGRAGSGKGKKNATRDQKGQKSIAKKCTPTGHISLKIKIGNKICSLGNATENFTASGQGIPKSFDAVENKLGEKIPGDMVSPCERNLEKVMSSDASGLTSHLDVRGTSDNRSFNASSGFHQIMSQGEGESRCPDVGTSPDSEVINSVPDAPPFENGLPDTQDSAIMSKACFSPSDVPSLTLLHKNSKKGKKKDKVQKSKLTDAETKSKKGKKKNKLHGVGDCSVENKLTGGDAINNAKVAGDLGVGQKVGDVFHSSDFLIITAKPHLNGGELDPSSVPVAALVSSNSQVNDSLIPCSNGQKPPKCSRAKGGKKGKSIILDLPSKNGKVSKKKGNKNVGDSKHQVDEKVGAGGILSRVESLLATGNEIPSDSVETGALNKDLNEPVNSFQFPSGVVRDQYIIPRNAWVLCDECQKWRRIPATLADQIEETNCRWTCKDNTDKDFADCCIPQEKSNSEINEELEISDASCEEDPRGAILKSNQNYSKVAQRPSWSLIKSNLFLHRGRKSQTIDEVMVCHCNPPSDSRMGCGDNCLNRMLNIECVRGTCPCGELCSNQQFQKRKYAKLKWFKCGKKGYGLQALEDVSQGQFLIEYVGEVLDMHAYEARQREYALNGHKHFYFMTLNGSEVIDACAKGNLGRFINHSCNPNCRTEKWMVNGEVCVGLFALRNIKKGEEVTFDYNYVRVFGAAAKKCVCGSTYCRGYIGGDPTNSEVIVQDDSDDEYSEPVMICESKEMNEDWNDIMSNTLNDTENGIANEPPENNSTKSVTSAVDESNLESHTSRSAGQKVEGVKFTQVETMIRERFNLHYSDGNNSVANAIEQLDIGKVTGEPLNVSMSATLEADTIESKRKLKSSDTIESAVTTASPSKSLSDTTESKRKLNYATVGSDELEKSKPLAKIKHSSSSIKKGKLKMKVVNDKATLDVDKLNAVLNKSKKFPELHLKNHVEAVEEKLNELLDPEGGISKRKDASRGYLKLLFLTAASGNNGHGEAIQSNRDLSMILDALLKTKSRTVLVDIINKNGLQMLHNIMKRYRKEFIKTPILRKLLKVLEYLAMREILTLEHITGGPPCPGVESFKDSILTLTEHADKQVHQIARNFRDRWIPRSHRKNSCIEWDDGRTDFHQRSSYGGSSVSYDHRNDKGVIISRETQPVAASSTVETPGLDVPSASGGTCGINGTKTRKRKSRWDTPAEEYPSSKIRNNLEGDKKQNMDEDFPPGFSPPCNGPKVPLDASPTAISQQERETHIKKHRSDSIMGDPQLRFVSRVPVSYGVPSFIMQQLGVLKVGKSEGWTIAPGVPFHPFPPLPPHALGSGDQPTSTTRCASLSDPTEETEHHSDNFATYHTGQQHTTTCSIDPPESVSLANGRPSFQQGGSNGLGRKYFRQQKWNHSKMAPPWVRMRNGWGYTGNNARNSSPGVGLGNGTNEFRDSYNSEEVNWRGGL